MTPEPRDEAPASAPLLALLVLAVGFILYGSLYPFRVVVPEGGISAALEAGWTGLRERPALSRGDILANVLLYLPFGALLVAWQAPRWGSAAVPMAALAGALLSVGIEAAQLFLPERNPSLLDIICNIFGSISGAIAARLLGAPLPLVIRLLPRMRVEPFAALLVLAWLGYRLYPYVPRLDWQGWKESLKPLLLQPMFEPLRTFRLSVAWLVFAWMLGALAGPRGVRWLVPLVILVAVASEVVIVDHRLSVAAVLGALFGLLGWWLLGGAEVGVPPPRVAALLLVPMLMAVLAERLEPFTFTAVARPFGWIPFRSLMGSYWGLGLQAMLEKAFFYGGLLWLAVRAGFSLPLAAVSMAGLLLMASVAQTYLPGRSGEITDALLVLALAAILYLLDVRGRSAVRAGA